MDTKRFALIAVAGCGILLLLLVMVVSAALLIPGQIRGLTAWLTQEAAGPVATVTPQETVPTLVPQAATAKEASPTATSLSQRVESAPSPQARTVRELLGITSGTLPVLYNQLNPGVVNIQVFVQRQGLPGQGAGSGFIFDNQGHIITNNHVVAEAKNVTVVFHDGFEAEAEIVGTDVDSDLAVLHVGEFAEGAHPLPLGDSDEVKPGQLAIAIGNPFRFGGSMTLGVVSAVGRTIPAGPREVIPFQIPQAIQTDAAINPGNSGGPLLNLEGEVIGVNAQIRTGGTQANAGVGFAIPSNIVRRVAPVLIEQGEYEWPWLGVSGHDVDLFVQRANELDTQRGAYIREVVPDSPAAEAGLRGSTGAVEVQGFQIPVGGDIVIEVNGKPVADFSDLLVDVAFESPGDTIELTIIRDGQRREVTVELAPRPENLGR